VTIKGPSIGAEVVNEDELQTGAWLASGSLTYECTTYEEADAIAVELDLILREIADDPIDRMRHAEKEMP